MKKKLVLNKRASPQTVRVYTVEVKLALSAGTEFKQSHPHELASLPRYHLATAELYSGKRARPNTEPIRITATVSRPETKHRHEVEPGSCPLVELIQECDAFDRVCLASFHDHRIARSRALAGDKLCVSAGRISVAKHLLRSYGVLPSSKPFTSTFLAKKRR